MSAQSEIEAFEREWKDRTSKQASDAVKERWRLYREKNKIKNQKT